MRCSDRQFHDNYTVLSALFIDIFRRVLEYIFRPMGGFDGATVTFWTWGNLWSGRPLFICVTPWLLTAMWALCSCITLGALLTCITLGAS